MIFGEVDSLLSLGERIWRWFKNPIASQETIASRFVQIFESHAINRNQIPKFFGHGLTIADVQTDELLLPKLSEEILADACSIFAIRRQWLDGEDKQIYPLHNFYKMPAEFDRFLKSLGPNENYRIQGELLVVKNKSKKLHFDAILVIEETIGEINDRPVYRYHICDNWIFTYWKARVYMAACVAAASRNGVYVKGRYISEEYFNKYSEGLQFFKYEIGNSWGAMPPPGSGKWYPDRLLDDPEFFLEGIDEAYGLKTGLSFWLDLEEQGDLKCGEHINPAKSRFKEKLVQMQSAEPCDDDH